MKVCSFQQHFNESLKKENTFGGTSSSKTILELDNLSSSVKNLLDGVPIKTAVTGEFGVGKSFLLNVLLEYTSPSEHEYAKLVSQSKGGLKGLLSAPPTYRKTNYDFGEEDKNPTSFSFSPPPSQNAEPYSPSTSSFSPFESSSSRPYRSSSFSFSSSPSTSSPASSSSFYSFSNSSSVINKSPTKTHPNNYDNLTGYSFNGKDNDQSNLINFQVNLKTSY